MVSESALCGASSIRDSVLEQNSATACCKEFMAGLLPASASGSRPGKESDCDVLPALDGIMSVTISTNFLDFKLASSSSAHETAGPFFESEARDSAAVVGNEKPLNEPLSEGHADAHRRRVAPGGAAEERSTVRGRIIPCCQRLNHGLFLSVI